jgi:chromosome segregation ATPase
MSANDSDYVDQFRFEDREDKIVAEDKDGYFVELEVSDLTGKDSGQENTITANWEDVLCPIIHETLFSSDEVENVEQVETSVNEFSDKLKDIIKDDRYDTGSITEEIDSNALDRHSKVLTEYLIHTGVLQYNKKGNLELLNNEKIRESDVMEAGESVVDYIIKWSGTLEIVLDGLSNEKESIDNQLKSVEERVDKRIKRKKEMEEEIKKAREEISDICEGENLTPAKTDNKGYVIEPPKELDSNNKRERYKDKYNKIVENKRSMPGTEGDVLRATVKQLKNTKRKLDNTENSIDRRINDLRGLAALAHNTEEWEGQPVEDYMNRVTNVSRELIDCMGMFSEGIQSTKEETQPNEVLGINDEIDEEKRQKVDNLEEDVEEKSESVNNQLDDTKEGIDELEEDMMVGTSRPN